MNAAQSLSFLKMLAHDLRWQLVQFLAESDFRVQELVTLLNQPQNLVSYHLKQLREAQLVVERRSTADARDVYYSLDLEHIERAYRAVGTALHPAFAQSDRPAQYRPDGGKRVLFLCTENSARSQMAEALLRSMGGTGLEVFSAGTMPAYLHPDAIRVMADLGIDIRQQRAKSADEFRGQTFDYIISVCDRARESCPDFRGEAHRIHWSLPDPAATQDVEARYLAFTQTAEQLTVRIRYLIALMQSQKEVTP